MFTGIIETTGKVASLEKEKGNLRMGVEASFAKDLKIGQSVAHNGVCLTVEAAPLSSRRGNRRLGTKFGGEVCYYVTAIKETLSKTNLGSLKKGSIINLERCLKVGDRLDGHFVQGHVDTTATCVEIKKEKGSWMFKFGVRSLESGAKNLIINKGSICINGISLTIASISNPKPLTPNSQPEFSVAIIPHTFKHTNFNTLKKGDIVNIEFDILGKYIQKIIPIAIGMK